MLLTLVMLNKLRCHAHFQFSANQITWSRLLIQIHILNGKQCRSRSVGFFRSQLIWIYTVCKYRVYPGSAGQGLRFVWSHFAEAQTYLKVYISNLYSHGERVAFLWYVIFRWMGWAMCIWSWLKSPVISPQQNCFKSWFMVSYKLKDPIIIGFGIKRL